MLALTDVPSRLQELSILRILHFSEYIHTFFRIIFVRKGCVEYINIGFSPFYPPGEAWLLLKLAKHYIHIKKLT